MTKTDMVQVESQRCFVCGETGIVNIPRVEYDAWIHHPDGPIQQYLVSVPAEIREMLISGTHPACWDYLYGTDEEEYDE